MLKTVKVLAMGLVCIATIPAAAQDGCTTNGCTSMTGCADGLFGGACNRLTDRLCGEGCGAGGCGLLGGGCGAGSWLENSCIGGLFGEHDNGITLGGWTQYGYHNRDGLIRFNTHPDRVNLHQGYLYLEKVADGSECPDWGFRFDAVYGVDGADTQAFGNNPGRWDYQNGFDHGQFAWALPQAYVEYASGQWNVKAGHFYTLVGYEVVTAPDNFFYSHAFTMFNSEPFTHTGVIASYEASDDLTLYGGWTLGWDTGFDQFGNGNNFLGGASVSVSDDATLTYITTIGDFGARGQGYSHSIVLDVSLTDDLNYVFQSDLVDTNGTFNLFGTNFDDQQIGINQYMLYTINDQWAAGVRYEWWAVDGTSVNDVTIGLNFKPMDNVVVRPEFRHDWCPAADYSRSFFGVDAILTL